MSILKIAGRTGAQHFRCRSVVGRRHRRDALCALSGAGRAARYLRKARRLRDDLQARPFNAGSVASYSLGQAGRYQRICVDCRRAVRADVRCDEFEHLSGSARAEAFVQIRQPLARRSALCVNRRSSTISNASRSAKSSARKHTQSGLATAATLPGKRTFGERWNAISKSMREIYAALPDDWRLFHRAQVLRAGVLFDRHQRLGNQLSLRARIGRKAFCLVDLGHHAPNVNIEMIVSRLIQFGSSADFISTIASMATTISTPVRSSRFSFF